MPLKTFLWTLGQSTIPPVHIQHIYKASMPKVDKNRRYYRLRSCGRASESMMHMSHVPTSMPCPNVDSTLPIHCQDSDVCSFVLSILRRKFRWFIYSGLHISMPYSCWQVVEPKLNQADKYFCTVFPMQRVTWMGQILEEEVALVVWLILFYDCKRGLLSISINMADGFGYALCDKCEKCDSIWVTITERLQSDRFGTPFIDTDRFPWPPFDWLYFGYFRHFCLNTILANRHRSSPRCPSTVDDDALMIKPTTFKSNKALRYGLSCLNA